jgi:hypothetical protein
MLARQRILEDRFAQCSPGPSGAVTDDCAYWSFYSFAHHGFAVRATGYSVLIVPVTSSNRKPKRPPK